MADGGRAAVVGRPVWEGSPNSTWEARLAVEREGVIDVGSHSVRLVVYAGGGRVPIPIFNERALCGLGRGLSETGRLNPEGRASAIENLARFFAAATFMGVRRPVVLATEAVRAAADGPSFVAEIERRFGSKVEILKGEAEATYSALGVVSGIPDAYGLMGDLGGGSLELAEVEQGTPHRTVTMPIGSLRLMGSSEGSHKKARKLVDDALAKAAWIHALEGRSFYPVGGAWRALASVHMSQRDYPLHVIHEYTMTAGEAVRLLDVVMGLSPSSLAKIPRVPKKRLETLPYAALVLRRIIAEMKPEKLVFSSYGLREGYLFDKLSPQDRSLDPLIVEARRMAQAHGRFGEHGAELVNWTTPLFGKETNREKRLRYVACLMADVGWNEHPDYRAEQAYMRVLRMPFTAIDHAGRAFVALAVRVRYGGGVDSGGTKAMRGFLSDDDVRKARALGRALRLAYSFTAGNLGLLAQAPLSLERKSLVLTLPKGGDNLLGETTRQRLVSLARALDRKAEVDGALHLDLGED
jgi:exopolyphosphatase / guanosine-5'-triphosphate,3'-diphosphate pyrophosphatase